MNNYEVRSYTDAKGRTLWGVTMLDGQAWAIEPKWSESMAQAIARELNANPNIDPWDLEVGNDK